MIFEKYAQPMLDNDNRVMVNLDDPELLARVIERANDRAATKLAIEKYKQNKHQTLVDFCKAACLELGLQDKYVESFTDSEYITLLQLANELGFDGDNDDWSTDEDDLGIMYDELQRLLDILGYSKTPVTLTSLW